MSDDLVKRLRESGSRSEGELHEDREEAANRIEELEAERKEADVAALERILKEHGRVFDAMVDAAEDAAGKGVSFNVVVGRAIRAALAEIKGEQP